jgi:hypothetical protein
MLAGLTFINAQFSIRQLWAYSLASESRLKSKSFRLNLTHSQLKYFLIIILIWNA